MINIRARPDAAAASPMQRAPIVATVDMELDEGELPAEPQQVVSQQRPAATAHQPGQQRPANRGGHRNGASQRHSAHRGKPAAAPLRSQQPAAPARGGMYVAPHRKRAAAATQPSAPDRDPTLDPTFQQTEWEQLRKHLNGIVNRVNAANLRDLVAQLFTYNIIRGRGLLCHSIIKAQTYAPQYTSVYAALVSVINTKVPEFGELLLKRIIVGFQRAYKSNNKLLATAYVRFIAHLTNYYVCHEILALELCTMLLQHPTDDSVAMCVEFLNAVGMRLSELSAEGLNSIVERLRTILQDTQAVTAAASRRANQQSNHATTSRALSDRVQYMIEDLLTVRRQQFADYPAIQPTLDLVETEDQITHDMTLEEQYDDERQLDFYAFDSEWKLHEQQYELIKKEILGDDDEEEDADDEAIDGEDELEESKTDTAMVEASNGSGTAVTATTSYQIEDRTDADLINLRRTIYLTIMSSLTYEECAHKLLKQVRPGQESEVISMVLECCSVERTYLRFYGLLAERFCLVHRTYAESFDKKFAEYYITAHRHDTNKLRNIAKLYAHLLYTDALEWSILEYIQLTEEDTTSAGRIFLKILFRELSENMGLLPLNTRLHSPKVQPYLAGVIPLHNDVSPKDLRFAINFFTSIGLGGLTEAMREHLKVLPQLQQQKQLEAEQRQAAIEAATRPALPPVPPAVELQPLQQADDSGSDSYSSSSSYSDSDSYDSFSDSDTEPRKRSRRSYRSSRRRSRSYSRSPSRSRSPEPHSSSRDQQRDKSNGEPSYKRSRRSRSRSVTPPRPSERHQDADTREPTVKREPVDPTAPSSTHAAAPPTTASSAAASAVPAVHPSRQRQIEQPAGDRNRSQGSTGDRYQRDDDIYRRRYDDRDAPRRRSRSRTPPSTSRLDRRYESTRDVGRPSDRDRRR